MKKDRTFIVNVLQELEGSSEVLGNHPVRVAVATLERYVDQERNIAIGWTHANACVALDKGNDPRQQLVPDILARARRDLAE